jgi:hypothetical protein
VLAIFVKQYCDGHRGKTVILILLKNPPVLKNHQINLKYSQVEIIPGSVVGDFLLVAGRFGGVFNCSFLTIWGCSAGSALPIVGLADATELEQDWDHGASISN